MKKILIIEDDPIVAQVYQTKLESEGFNVEVALDGQAGFFRLQETRPDCLLLDLMLPHINGVEILRKIRVQRQFQKLPVFVFTNMYVSTMIQEATDAGATQVFNKAAITPRIILETINATLFPRLHGLVAVPTKEKPVRDFEWQDLLTGEEPFNQKTPAPSHQGQPAAPRPAPVQAGLGNAAKETDTTFQAEIRQAFLKRAPQTLGALRRHLHALTKSELDPSRQSELFELCRLVHSMTGNAGIAGLVRLADMSSAFEALLKELYDKPASINSSTLRTVAHAADFVGTLYGQATQAQPPESTPPLVLTVDDDLICRRTIGTALEKARLRSVSVGEPSQALALLKENPFNLIFLDVEMPGMNGFELCQKLREIPAHKSTPVVFVTSLTDFDTRTRSILTSGNDLIAKPFLLIELAVKALIYVLNSPTNAAPNPA